MGIQGHPIDPHWNYLLALDGDLVELARYVEFHEDNFGCFSIAMARLLRDASAEVEVVCKQLCQAVNSQSATETIHAYRDELIPAFPTLPMLTVRIPRFGLSLHPWEQWRLDHGVPFWWTAHNKVKHERHTHYAEGNLKNAINAVAGLFVVVLYLYKDRADRAELAPSPQLLRLDPGRHSVPFNETNGGISYELD